MPFLSDHPTDAPPRLFPAASLTLHLPALAGGLSDRQAVIAVMVANGRSCEEISADLSLPLRAVQGHLYEAMTILGLSSMDELTSAALASHVGTSTPVAPGNTSPAASGSPRRSRPDPVADSQAGGVPVLTVEETTRIDHREGDLLATLTRELAATQLLLQQKVDKLQEYQQALRGRDTIGQAKGILMERHKISAHHAFTILQDESSRSNRKLVQVAEQLVHSGEGMDQV
ncbi:ANTAR domain-containing protein [Arthrobacter sp. B0490]|uniref:ANTAR domain-containing protein n=1 Tax=Arthrobacter sp. B0490 TaxID=2058891 RepID=UPI000CE3E6E0|nr:ANTAR domain-containing protein [Arthrobacter sp. B0490]